MVSIKFHRYNICSTFSTSTSIYNLIKSFPHLRCSTHPRVISFVHDFDLIYVVPGSAFTQISQVPYFSFNSNSHTRKTKQAERATKKAD